MATAVSFMRLEKPHSLSYQDITRTSEPSMTLVWSMWKIEECGSWLKSDETFFSSVKPRMPFSGPEVAAARMAGKVRHLWDMPAYDAEVRESQARRHVVYAALRNGAYYPWDFQPLKKASERYMRNHMDLNVLEASQRWPRGD